jgi:hypothetical protein
MKKIFIFMACIAYVSVTLIGCGILTNDIDRYNTDNLSDDSFGIKGYVVAKENNRVLVVDPIPQDFSANGGVSEFYNAIWVSGDTKQIEIGEMVQAWFDAVADSYPGQAQATKISVIESEKVGGADLNKAEVIRKALTSDNLNLQSIIVVKSVSYDMAIDSWKVIIKQGEDEVTIEVIDELVYHSSVGDVPKVPVKELEDTFRNGIYQEVDEATRKVKKFDTKAQWVQYMSEIMDERLAQTFAHDFFNEKEDGLYLISRSGPVVLVFEEHYETKEIKKDKIQVIQTSENILFGKYKLTITYEYRDNRWIIIEREFLSYDLYPTDKLQQ